MGVLWRQFQSFAEECEVGLGFVQRQIRVCSPIFFDKRDEVALFDPLHHGSRGDFWRRQLNPNAIGFPITPIEPSRKAAPNIGVFRAMKSTNGIHAEKTTSRALSRNLNLAANPLIFIYDRIRRTFNAARAMVEMQIMRSFRTSAST